MVEGHYHDMQELFRSQSHIQHATENYDIMAELMRYLDEVQPAVLDALSLTTDMITLQMPMLLNIAIQVLATILELIQGPCHSNVMAVAQSSFLNTAERLLFSCKYNREIDILKTDGVPKNTNIVQTQCTIKTLILSTYRALIEGTGIELSGDGVNPDAQVVARRMIEVLNYEAMMEEAAYIRDKCWEEWERNPLSDTDLHKRLLNLRSEALNYLFLTQELDMLDMKTSNTAKGDPKCANPYCAKYPRCNKYCLGHARLHTQALNQFFNGYTCAIEAQHAGKIEKVYFELTDHCRMKLRDMKWVERTKRVIFDVPRNNPKEKLEAMLDKIVLVLYTLKHERELYQRAYAYRDHNDSKSILTKSLNMFTTVFGGMWLLQDNVYSAVLGSPFLVSLLILCIMTISYDDGGEKWKNSAGWWSVLLLGWLQVLMCALATVLFLVKEAMIISFKERQSKGQEDPQRLLNVKEPIRWTRQTMWAVLYNYRFWFLLFLMLAAVLGATYSPFCFALHLLDFLVHSSAGSEVMQSARVGGPALGRTFLVGILVIVLYSIVSFVAFRDYLTMDRIAKEANEPPGGHYAPNFNTNQHCTTLYQCVGQHILNGLTGHIGSVFGDPVVEWFPWNQVPEGIDDYSSFQTRSMFIMSFFVIWGFLLSNIMTGQIVEAFTDIRNKKQSSQRDLAERCFVCSLERSEFEHNKSVGEFGFIHHVATEHNPLFYLYYLDYLLRVDETEYTGLEAVIAKSLKEKRGKRTDWMPVNCSLQVERQHWEMESKKDVASKQQEETVASIKFVDVTVKDMDRRITRIEEQIRGVQDSSNQILQVLKESGVLANLASQFISPEALAASNPAGL